jgi:hypothetical protein
VDSLDIEVDCCSAGSVTVTAGNSLGNALMRPGHTAVDLILDQDGAQVRLAEDQNAVEELAAQGADEAFTSRIGTHSQQHPVRMISTDVCG